MAFSMTVSEYARHRGCDEKAVRKAIDEGRITAIGEGRGRRIDPDVADIQWARNTRARGDSGRGQPAPTVAPPPAPGASAPAAAPPPAPAAPDYSTDRARRERIEADRAQLALEKDQKTVIDRQRGELGAMTAFRELRDACQASHKNTAPRVVGQTDVRSVLQILDEGYRLAFEDAERRIAEVLERWRTHGA